MIFTSSNYCNIEILNIFFKITIFQSMHEAYHTSIALCLLYISSYMCKKNPLTSHSEKAFSSNLRFVLTKRLSAA